MAEQQQNLHKDKLLEDIEKDRQNIRDALNEIIQNSRSANNKIFEALSSSDFTLLEEFGILNKGIIDAAKLLSEVNAQTPKTITTVNEIKQPKQKININDLLDDPKNHN
jgi:hypothetical protein